MEIYNQLLQQFHCPSPTEHLIGQYKHLHNQLADLRNKRKTHFLIKKTQLQHFQNAKHQELNEHLAFENVKKIKSTQIVDLQSFQHSKSDLKREISQLQSEISGFREKTEALNSELQLYSNKHQELQVINKRSQLQVFNSIQQLYIYANRLNAQQQRQREMLNQLCIRKETITNEIETLVKKKEENADLIAKWGKSKQIKQKTIIESSKQLQNLQQIIKQLYGLADLQNFYKNKQIGFYKNHQYPQLNPLKIMTKRTQIIKFLKQQKIQFNSHYVSQIITFYKSIQNQLNRNQRANNRINQHLQFLNQTDEKLTTIIEKETQKKQNQTLNNLKNIEDNAKQISIIFTKNCKVITFFTTIFFPLFKRFHAFKKSIQTILIQAKSQLINSIEIESGATLLQNYEQYLYRNSQELQIKWSQCDHSSLDFYKNYIEKNDLIRLFANPSSFNKANDNLQNFQIFSQSSFRNANLFLKKLMEEIQKYFTQTHTQTIMKSIKQINESKRQFCVESRQYYRRDNYKLLQKLQKIQLKKKGLLSQLPLNIKFQNQLVSNDQNNNSKQYRSLFTSRKSTFHKEDMKYTAIATKRQENSRTGSVLRRMLSRINSLSNRSFTNKHPQRSTINSTKLTLNDTINSFISSKHQNSRISRFPRNTQNIVRKLHPPDYISKLN